MKNSLKIAYILIAGVGVFFINNIWILLGVFALHFLLYFFIKNEQKSLRFLWKIKWFALLIFMFHAFTGENDIPILQIKKWVLALSYDGLLKGSVMVLKLLSMLTITQVVRLSMKKKEFIRGMRGFGMSDSVAQTVDAIMEIIHTERKDKKGNGNGGGQGKGKGSGKGNNNKEKGGNNNLEDDKASDVLFKGRVGRIPQRLMNRLQFASEQFKNNPHANMASAALAITLIRMVKIAPGLPLAPGHKNILIFPAFIYGITRTKNPFAGMQIGLISGILHFSMGFGKYGPLSVIEFALIGAIMQLMLLIPIKRDNLFFLMLIGGVAGATRIGIEIALATILDMPSVFYIIYLPYIISQTAFGVASGFISKAILKKEQNNEQTSA